MTKDSRPTGLYCAYMEALARKREREGRIVKDVVDDPDYWHRRAHWHAKQNEWVEQDGLNTQEREDQSDRDRPICQLGQLRLSRYSASVRRLS